MEGFGYDPMGDSSNASVAPQRGSSKLARDKVPGPRSPNEKALKGRPKILHKFH